MTTQSDSVNEYIKFQVLDWDEYHSEGASGDMEYRVRLFGRTDDDKTIYCDVRDFTPYFYVKVNKKANCILMILNAQKTVLRTQII